jgi:hypothetical protein
LLERIHLEKRQVRGLDDTAGFGCSTVAAKVDIIALVGCSAKVYVLARIGCSAKVYVLARIGSAGAFIISLVIGALFCVII